jgi:hypothetical protein
MKNKIKILALAISAIALSHAAMAQAPWTGTALTGDSYRTGNVGIGTSTPTEKLDVNGNIVLPFGNFIGTSGTTYKKLIQTGWDAANFDFLSFYTAGANADDLNEKMRITMNGNVGIGYTNPEAKLHVFESTALGSTVLSKLRLTSATGNVSGGNNVSQSTWLYRSTSGSSWTSTSVHDGISVDNSFKDPGSNTKTWWQRQPYLDVQSWGNAGTTYMSLEQGKLCIGTKRSTAHSNASLSVDGKIVCKDLYVTATSDWPDFVFKANYVLPKLYDIEAYYKENGHLPLIPSEQDIKEKGIDVAEMNRLLLLKVEELTVLMVEQQKQIDILKTKIEK